MSPIARRPGHRHADAEPMPRPEQWLALSHIILSGNYRQATFFTDQACRRHLERPGNVVGHRSRQSVIPRKVRKARPSSHFFSSTLNAADSVR